MWTGGFILAIGPPAPFPKHLETINCRVSLLDRILLDASRGLEKERFRRRHLMKHYRANRRFPTPTAHTRTHAPNISLSALLLLPPPPPRLHLSLSLPAVSQKQLSPSLPHQQQPGASPVARKARVALYARSRTHGSVFPIHACTCAASYSSAAASGARAARFLQKAFQ